MHNDSLETLLLRHYGRMAPTPAQLEQRLQKAVRHQGADLGQQQQLATRLRAYRINRRQAIHFVALGTAGLGILSAGLESLHLLEAALGGQDVTLSASF